MCHPEYAAGANASGVSSREVGIRLKDGHLLPALEMQPAVFPAPAVLVLHDARGPGPFYESLARRVATAGFVALLPDLYFRVDPSVTRDPTTAAQLDYQQTIDALCAAVDWLRVQHEVAGQRLGTVGFSLGGTLVLDLAAERADLATATFYAFPSGRLQGSDHDPLRLVDRIRGPLVGFFGERDEVVPPADVRQLERGLRDRGVEVEFTLYPDVGHHFVAGSQLDPFVATSFAADYTRACESWTAALTFFREQLGSAWSSAMVSTNAYPGDR
jgi:carboxymethylenebutenolidase